MSDLLFIVIPAKDEAPRLAAVIGELRSHGYHQIIVVDDGSKDDTGSLAHGLGCTVLRHALNMGSGAATQTGIEYALSMGAAYILTMDADGQHASEDIDHLFEAIQQHEVDVVIGSRFMDLKGKVPFSRRFFNLVANWVTWAITGVHVTDSQSGMKIMKADFAQGVEFHFNGFEFCTELFHILKRNEASYMEIPIRAIYTPESMQKGQSFWVGLKMFFRLILWKR